MVEEVRRLAASEATSGELPQSNDCPSPAERGIMKPFDRLHELALSDEALPDSGAGLLLGDKDASVREHCAAMAYVWRVRRQSFMVVSKGGPLLAAAEAAIDVDSPPGPARLEGLEVFGRALHTTPLVGVASTVVPGCTSDIATCDDSKTRRAAPHRPAGTAGSSATRRAAPATHPRVCGFAWVCIRL